MPIITKRKILIGFLIALVVVVALALWYFSSLRTYDLSLGKRYAYHLSYRHAAKTVILLPRSEALRNDGEIQCELRWDLVPFRFVEGVYSIALFLSPGGECRFLFNGKDLFDDAAFRERLFGGRYAVIRMDARGTIRGVAFRKSEEALYKGFVRTILADLQFFLPGDLSAGWREKEHDRYGAYEADYRRNGMPLFSHEVEKKRDPYLKLNTVSKETGSLKQAVTGSLTARFARAGHLGSLAGEQAVTVDDPGGERLFGSAISIDMRLESIVRFKEALPATDAGVLEESSLARIDVDERAIRRIWEERAASLTIPEMADLIRRYALSGDTGEGGAAAWRIIAYLKLHPERCKELLPLFTDNAMTAKGRLFVYGLLVGAGHSEAQKTMRDLLGTEAARKEAMYSIYLQQFSQVEKPDAATAEFMEGLYEHAKKEGRYRSSTILTLGALAGKLANSGSDPMAAKLNGMLIQDLQKAKDPKEKEQLLDGLGNAGLPSNIPLIGKFVGDKDQRVRASVPMALRKTQTPESEQLVLSLTGDGDSLMQKQALATLSHYALTSEHLTGLRDQLKAGRITESSYFEILNLVSKYPQERVVTREILQEMKRRVSNNPHLEARINQMLGR